MSKSKTRCCLILEFALSFTCENNSEPIMPYDTVSFILCIYQLLLIGLIPDYAAYHGAWPRIPVRCWKLILATNYANYLTFNIRQTFGRLLSQILAPQTITYSNQRALLAASVSSAASHDIGIRYYLSWDLAIVGQIYIFWSPRSSILKRLGYIFLP